MPESGGENYREGVRALREELRSARALLLWEREVERALRAGAPADELNRLVRGQEGATRDAARAARERQRWFEGPGSLERWCQGLTGADADAVRSLGSEAAEVRRELLRLAERCRYLARKGVEWSEGQMEAVVRLVAREGSTYSGAAGAAGSRTTPSLTDHIA